MQERVFLEYFDGCTQRTFGQWMRARYEANAGCAQPTYLMWAAQPELPGFASVITSASLGYLLSVFNKNSTLKSKEPSEYSPHSSTANHTPRQLAPTRTASIKGKAGSKDGWSKDREEKHPGLEEDDAAQPAASAQKLRSQDQAESLVATRYVLDSDSN